MIGSASWPFFLVVAFETKAQRRCVNIRHLAAICVSSFLVWAVAASGAEAQSSWLGVRVQPVTKQIARNAGLRKAQGAFIEDVEAGSPADVAGLRADDVVVQLNGSAVVDANEIAATVASLSPGAQVEIGIVRERQQLALVASLGEIPGKALGLEIANITGELRSRYRLDASTRGVVIVNIEPGYADANGAPTVGDIIVSVAQVPVTTRVEFQRQVEDARRQGRKAVQIGYARVDGSKASVDMTAQLPTKASPAAAMPPLTQLEAPQAELSNDVDLLLAKVKELLRVGDYAAAVEHARRLEAVAKRKFGTDHLNYATVLNVLSKVISDTQGKHVEAENIDRRVLAIYERTLAKRIVPAEALQVVIAETIAHIAIEQVRQGKYVEAEAGYRRASPMFERYAATSYCSRLRNVWVQGDPCHFAILNLAGNLNNLAILYVLQGRPAEAEGLHRRALEIYQRESSPNPDNIASVFDRLAAIKRDQGKFAEAETEQRKALAIFEKAFGTKHVVGGGYLNNLGTILRLQGKSGEAEATHRRALASYEQALGPSSFHVAEVLNALGLAIQAQGRFADAEPLLLRAAAIDEQNQEARLPATLDALAELFAVSGKISDALRVSRKASDVAIGRTLVEASAQKDETSGAVQQLTSIFRNHVANLALAARQGVGTGPMLGVEGFAIAQWATQSAAAAALQQTAARFATGSNAQAGLVRESQDLLAQKGARDKLLVAALSQPEAQQNSAVLERLRKEMAGIESRILSVNTKLEREFPDYAALTRPQPLGVEDTQKLLSPDEALVFILTGDKESYVFAMTRGEFLWKTIPLGAKTLSEKVADFRRGLDVDETTLRAGKSPLFSLKSAHELYMALLDPVAKILIGKRDLIIVPSGPLTSLPFQLLVSDKPSIEQPTVDDLVAYRNAGWLIKRHALTVLPSVASLKALRVFGAKSPAEKAFVGYGDPIFDRGKVPPQRRPEIASAGQTRAYSSFWRGSRADLDVLAQGLAPLPETAMEVTAIAKTLDAPASDIHLGRAATETAVKKADLSGYRIVYFATHGLVAGEIQGLGEPALVFSLPAEATDLDDGLLTASEISQLKLNADWVVLSACNTAAGDKPGAGALSGLARAFFYAGTRALLVSHWRVESGAAVRLTTSTFNALQKDQSIGRAEALRRAMLAYVNDTSNPWNAYPDYWGPFSVVGEGGAKR